MKGEATPDQITIEIDEMTEQVYSKLQYELKQKSIEISKTYRGGKSYLLLRLIDTPSNVKMHAYNENHHDDGY